MTNAVLVTASCQHLEHFHFPDYTGQTLAYLQLDRKFVSMGKEGKYSSFPVAHCMCHFICDLSFPPPQTVGDSASTKLSFEFQNSSIDFFYRSPLLGAAGGLPQLLYRLPSICPQPQTGGCPQLTRLRAF